MAIIATKTHAMILEATVVLIQSLDLDGISDANIALRVFDEDLTKCLPGPPGVMVLAGSAERVSHLEGSNKSKLIQYPVGVVIGDRCIGSFESEVEVNRNLGWRQDIRNNMWHKAQELRDAGAPSTVLDVRWEPGRIFLPPSWKKLNMWVQGMTFMVETEEPI